MSTKIIVPNVYRDNPLNLSASNTDSLGLFSHILYLLLWPFIPTFVSTLQYIPTLVLGLRLWALELTFSPHIAWQFSHFLLHPSSHFFISYVFSWECLLKLCELFPSKQQSTWRAGGWFLFVRLFSEDNSLLITDVSWYFNYS